MPHMITAANALLTAGKDPEQKYLDKLEKLVKKLNPAKVKRHKDGLSVYPTKGRKSHISVGVDTGRSGEVVPSVAWIGPVGNIIHDDMDMEARSQDPKGIASLIEHYMPKVAGDAELIESSVVTAGKGKSKLVCDADCRVQDGGRKFQRAVQRASDALDYEPDNMPAFFKEVAKNAGVGKATARRAAKAISDAFARGEGGALEPSGLTRDHKDAAKALSRMIGSKKDLCCVIVEVMVDCNFSREAYEALPEFK